MRTFAIIPAAGQSVRMGRPKLSLPLGDATILQWVIAALEASGIERVLVVLGPESNGLEKGVTGHRVDFCVLPYQTEDMSATVRAGLDWLSLHYAPRDDDFCLLVPADHPTIQAGVVGALLAASVKHTRCSIFLPTYEGRRGHPTLCLWKHAQAIVRSRWDQGLNVYFRQYAAETFELPWPTPEVLWDLDTPADYQRLLDWHQNQKSAYRPSGK